LQAITGKSASDGDSSIFFSVLGPFFIANAWNSGRLIVLCAETPASSFIVGSHCYAVVGYDATSRGSLLGTVKIVR
jgi:hypothetical protein